MIDGTARIERKSAGWVALALVAVVMPWTSSAAAQERSVGGHVGVAGSLISRSEGKTTTMSKALTIPIGVILRKNTSLPIDIGIAATLDDKRVNFSVGVNVARGLGRGFAAAGGVLVDVSDPAWGFVAALDKVLARMPGGTVLIGDLLVPVVFHKGDEGAGYTSVGVGMHVGVVF